MGARCAESRRRKARCFRSAHRWGQAEAHSALSGPRAARSPSRGQDRSFGFNNFEYAMQACQFKNLLDGRSWIYQPDRDGAVAAVDKFINGDQGAQAAAIDEICVRKIDLNGFNA